MEFSRKGTFVWYVGLFFTIIGFLFMFTIEELNDVEDVLNWALEKEKPVKK